MNNSENYQRFAQAVSTKTMQGYIVADRNDVALIAVLVKPAEKVNHVLHLIITIFTCVWAIVWIVLSINAAKEHRVRITLDRDGNLIEERIQI